MGAIVILAAPVQQTCFSVCRTAVRKVYIRKLCFCSCADAGLGQNERADNRNQCFQHQEEKVPGYIYGVLLQQNEAVMQMTDLTIVSRIEIVDWMESREFLR